MPRPHVLSAVVLLACLCACDSRKDFTGTYAVSGVLTYRAGTREDIVDIDAAQLVIVADAFDSDRLYLDFDCGLSATMKDGESFALDSKTCPSYTKDSCSFTWSFNNGEGTLTEDGTTLDFDSNGIVKGRCSDGSSGILSFSFNLKGVRKSGSEPEPALPGEQSREPRSRQMSALQARMAEAMRLHLQ